ncbi:hypothetical protein HKX48_006404 [Thoreauomyces humboldtii]|nr:hypothetical protein HKX48_006404 [Thoreauomyces humboldtii]
MDPEDPTSFNHKHAQVNGITYHYVDEGQSDNVIVLAHGFPDLWFGWRYQIGFLVSKGWRVIAPDLRGFGLTDAPHVEPGDEEGIRSYGLKNVCTDLVQLLDHVAGKDTKAVFLGHDWGGMVVWRMYLHYPHRVRAIASICVPFSAPNTSYLSPEALVKIMPQWKYQLWFARPSTDAEVDPHIGLVLSCIYRGAHEPFGLVGASSLSDLPSAQPAISSRLRLSPAQFAYYRDTYEKRGMHGPFNWYRTRRVNWEDEVPVMNTRKVEADTPVLMVLAKHDPALPVSMSAHIKEDVMNLTLKKLDTGHWAMMERPDELNVMLGEWLGPIAANQPKSARGSKL